MEEFPMEAVVQILEAEEQATVISIPDEMRHIRLEVTFRPAGEAAAPVRRAHTNREIMQKFQEAAESGEAKEHLKRKLAEGARFDFDAEKLISGTMTEDNWQNLYTLQKQAWSQAAVEKAGV
jgi:hypothetical protein